MGLQRGYRRVRHAIISQPELSPYYEPLVIFYLWSIRHQVYLIKHHEAMKGDVVAKKTLQLALGVAK